MPDKESPIHHKERGGTEKLAAPLFLSFALRLRRPFLYSFLTLG
jgi:hypothetical protein